MQEMKPVKNASVKNTLLLFSDRQDLPSVSSSAFTFGSPFFFSQEEMADPFEGPANVLFEAVDDDDKVIT